MQVYSQLEAAQFENKTSDPASPVVGRFWFRTDTAKAKITDGTTIRDFLLNDAKLIIGTNATAGTNTRLYRAGTGLLAFVDGAETTSEGSAPVALDMLAFRHEVYDNAGRPTFGQQGRIIWNTDAASLQVDTGAAWAALLSGTVAANQIAAQTASRALVSDGSGFISAATTTAAEIGYVNGVTSAIQTQLDGKTLKSTLTTKGDMYAASGSATPVRVPVTGNDGYVLTEDAASTGGVKFAAALTAPTSSSEISNLGLATSVASSALTIALKQADGATDPSTGNSAVKVGMRSSTLTSGLYNQRSATAATSLVISSGSTLGQASTKPANIYVYLLDNAGTLELAVSGTLYPEVGVISTTAEGGAGAADSSTVVYSTTARTNVPFRQVGVITNTQTTAGTWASAGTTLGVGNYGTLKVKNIPTSQLFGTATTDTYYTPPGVAYLKVRMVGGGSGGYGNSNSGSPGSGGASTFGTSLLSAGGGTGGGAGGTGSVTAPALTVVNVNGGVGQGQTALVTSTGGMGASSVFGGGGFGGVANAGAGQAGATHSGSGGGGGSGTATTASGQGGAAGAYIEAFIQNPSSSYAYTVGAGGAGATGTNVNGGAGAAGYIIVEEYYY
jgi:hypothetical protein